MTMRLKKYTRDAPYAFSFGVFPTLELLRFQAKYTEEVLLHSQGTDNEGVEKIHALCRTARIPVRTDDRAVERLALKENTYAIGVFQKYRYPLEMAANHLVLVQPSDMGNLGTIIRTALGFGIRNLALVRPAVDIFDPRAIRASMGAMFQMHFSYFDQFEDYRTAYTHHLYPFMLNGANPLQRVKFQAPFGLVFGNESSGLPDSFLRVGESVRIEHSTAIDSLNLAMAVGLAVYEATKIP